MRKLLATCGLLLLTASSLAQGKRLWVLRAAGVSLPFSEEDVAPAHQAWFWNGHAAITLDQGVTREASARGSNQVITESAPAPILSADGRHLFWLDDPARASWR